MRMLLVTNQNHSARGQMVDLVALNGDGTRTTCCSMVASCLDDILDRDAQKRLEYFQDVAITVELDEGS